ncbi:MAG: hypothetical protein QOH22_1563 [Gemmatimonadaceae bacterium]|jgi:hypothetical protein|nr:hypothetical protein [Gemmatimonadaceae bacterium]
MRRRLIVASLAVTGLLACTDSLTAPDPNASAAKPLPLPEYALQLRGDPLLKSVSEMLGRPQLAEGIDAAVAALDQSGSDSNEAVRVSLASARFSLMAAISEDTASVINETDVLSAVMTTTLDRIAQVEAEPAAQDTSAAPPPSR